MDYYGVYFRGHIITAPYRPYGQSVKGLASNTTYIKSIVKVWPLLYNETGL